ncbi:sigma D regulator [Exilibacterium tricleocarpae]|uniref:Sigma D regulator n=1 Tax=Exilibacterium tricleocarpae TaxID=2591008 RepID=A0A545TZ83_9GAMM|nr:sigma D regulator [Exilibacterium tricleocarpae]TQV82521.1 sigma D regulator [Exilibacterium tricleocarpae]
MLENCESARERWGGVSDIIDRWLQERQDMLVLYCNLSHTTDADSPDSERGPKLQRLCQIIVDYVSAGHFEVYDQLMREGREFKNDDALREAGKLYSSIDKTTEFILDFNDKYQETDDLSSLAKDLSELGEVMETRFEAEDRMIAVLHVAHKGLVT